LFGYNRISWGSAASASRWHIPGIIVFQVFSTWGSSSGNSAFFGLAYGWQAVSIQRARSDISRIVLVGIGWLRLRMNGSSPMGFNCRVRRTLGGGVIGINWRADFL